MTLFTLTRKLLPWIVIGELLAPTMVHAAVEIEHDRIEDSPAGSRIELAAKITDEENGVALARAYFKVPEAAEFLFAEMKPLTGTGNTYVATLPAPAADTEFVNYFLLVRSGDGEVVKSQDFSIRVTAPTGEIPPPDVVLEPGEFADVDGFHGKMLRIAGFVEVADADGSAVSPADAGYVVRASQTVRTGADGMVVIDFDRDPITILDHDSRVNVRTPNWFTHLAGKAYFTFKRLLAASERQRVVANTVALIGIRGTSVLSLAGDRPGLAVEEGSVDVASTSDTPMQLTRDGVSTLVDEFRLESDRMASFDGVLVSDTVVSADVERDIARLKEFATGLLGAVILAQSQGLRIDVQSESASAGTRGFSDSIRLVKVPQSSVLGLGATTGTVVASSAGLSATTISLMAAGAAVAAAGGSSGDSGDSGGDDSVGVRPPTDVSEINGSYSGSFSGTDFFDGGGSAPDSGPLAFTVSNGTMLITTPLSGSGSVSATGNADFVAGTVSGDGSECMFNGTFLLTGTGGVNVDGTYSCVFDDGVDSGRSDGTWTATRS